MFGELGEGGGLGVGVESFADGEFLLWLEGFGAGFVLTGGCGVEAAEGVDGFDGVIGAEGDGNAVGQHGSPGVGIGGAFGAQAGGGPAHIGKQMGRLHGGDDAELFEAVEVVGQQDLGVFDAEAQVGGLGLFRGASDDSGVGIDGRRGGVGRDSGLFGGGEGV